MLNKKWFGWRYKNTALLAASVILLIVFADHAIIKGIIAGTSQLGYFGIFFAGFFIVSTFTVVPATLLLSELSQTYGLWETVVLATIGAVLGDYIIFRFIKDAASEEFASILEFISKEKHLYKLFHSPFFAWVTPVIGAAVIASPLPDELGLSILGISQMSNKKFLLLVTVLDFLGILLLVSILRSI
jgi:uncharacterized membrane protein YdjX (TVP38/TMEM64 family)